MDLITVFALGLVGATQAIVVGVVLWTNGARAARSPRARVMSIVGYVLFVTMILVAEYVLIGELSQSLRTG